MHYLLVTEKRSAVIRFTPLPSLLICFLIFTISTSVQAQIRGDAWMEDLWDTSNSVGQKFQDRRLRDIVIPGTHDSATYALTNIALPGGDPWLAALQAQPGVTGDILQGYAKAQSFPLYEQLKTGARFFDLRFAKFDGNYRAHHSLIGSGYAEVFSDIERFLNEGHDKEIIILRFDAMELMTLDDHKEFVGFIFSQFRHWMAPNSSGYNTTPNDLYSMEEGPSNERRQLIVSYAGNRFEGEKPYPTLNLDDLGLSPADRALLWSGGKNGKDGLNNSWFGLTQGNKQYPDPSDWRSEERLQTFLRLLPSAKEMSSSNDPDSAFIVALPMGMTTDLAMFLNLLVPSKDIVGYESLQTAAAFTNPRLVPHLADLPRDMVNIVTVDFFESSGLLQQAVLLNSTPARVELSIKSVSGASSGEFYPRFHVSTSAQISPAAFTPTDRLSATTATSIFTADDHPLVVGYTNPITRNDGGPFDPTHRWQAPTWTYTVAAPWDQPLLTSVAIWEQDWWPGSDDFTGISAGLYTGPLSSHGEFSGLVQGGAGIYDISTQYNVLVSKWPEINNICPDDDEYENNDTRGAAKPISNSVRIAGIVCASDEDWFSISAIASHQITAVANFAHGDGDVDIALFDPAGNKVDSSTTYGNEENMSHLATQTGPYTVRVVGYGDAQNRYTLKVGSTIVPPLFEDGFEGDDRPDLVVSVFGVSSNFLFAGIPLIISATVRNNGGGTSTESTLRYYRSVDSVITQSDDFEVGADSINVLAPSAESAQNLILVPITGIFYYGACIDAVDSEIHTGNQCSEGLAVTVN